MSGERVGVVTHYFTHLGVAAITLESGVLRVGDSIRIKGHTTDFTQRIDSLQIEHAQVNEASAGASVGTKVKDRVRAGDTVFKIVEE